MYRAAPPSHVLYQGDVLIVPMPALRDRDPQLISDNPYPLPCRACGEPMDAPACPHCGNAPASGKRYTLASARFNRGENPFANDTASKVVANVEVVAAMVVSHSCDLDQRDYVRFAPVRVLTRLTARQQVELRAHPDGSGGPFGYLYLPAIGRMPEAAVCLGYPFHLRTAALGQQRPYWSNALGRNDNALAPYVEAIDSRLACLDGEGLSNLYRAVVRHDTRRERVALDAAGAGDAIADDDPDRPQRAALPQQGWWWPTPGWIAPPAAGAP